METEDKAILNRLFSKSKVQLLPKLSPKENLELLKKLRTLKLTGGRKEIDKILDRINEIRKSEKLKPISKGILEYFVQRANKKEFDIILRVINEPME
jgi:ABC-type multidrug transport system ATPase subunit